MTAKTPPSLSGARTAAIVILSLLALAVIAGAAAGAASARWGRASSNWSPQLAYGTNTVACTDPDGTYPPELRAYNPSGSFLTYTPLNTNGQEGVLSVPMSPQGTYTAKSGHYTKIGGFCNNFFVDATATHCFDTVVPTSSDSPTFTGTTTVRNGEFFVRATSTTATVTFTDPTPNCNGANVPGYICENGGSNACSWTGSLSLSGRGVHYLEWRSWDSADNLGSPKYATVYLDADAPTLSFSSACQSPAWCASGSVTVSTSDFDTYVVSVVCTGLGGPYSGTSQVTFTPPQGSNAFSCTATDAAGNTRTTTSPTYQFDFTNPTNPTASHTCTQGTGSWCKSSATVTIAGSTDTPSGVKEYRSIYLGVEQPGASRTLDQQGQNDMTYWAVDYSGRESARLTKTVYVDTVSPGLSIGLSCEATWCGSDVWVTFNVDEATSGVASRTCQINGLTADCNGQWVTAESGSHVASLSATDGAGNAAGPTTRGFKIDKTAPGVDARATCPGVSNNGWCQGSVTLDNTADAGAGSPISTKSCYLDGWSTTCGSQSYGTEGWRTYEVYASDAAGNSGYDSASFGVDQAAPTVWFNGPASNSWQKPQFPISVHDADSGSGLSGCDWRTATSTYQGRGCDASFTADCGAVSTCTVFVRATDGSGRFTEINRGYRIDPDAPTTAAATQGGTGTLPGQRWYNTAATVTLTCADNPASASSGCAGTYYRVDGGGQQTYSGPVSLTANGDHSIEYWSFDAVGNEEGHQWIQVGIDRVAPTSSVAVTSPYTTSTLQPSFKVGYADGDTGSSGLSKCFTKVVGFSGGFSTGDTGYLERPCGEQNRVVTVDAVVTPGNCRIVPALGGTCRVYTYSQDVAGNVSPEFYVEVAIPPRT